MTGGFQGQLHLRHSPSHLVQPARNSFPEPESIVTQIFFGAIINTSGIFQTYYQTAFLRIYATRTFYLLPLLNAASNPGRIGPAFLASTFGPINMLLPLGQWLPSSQFTG